MEKRTIIGPPPRKFGYITLITFVLISLLTGSFVFIYEFPGVCEAKLILKGEPIPSGQVKLELLNDCGIIENEKVELQAVGSKKMIQGVVFNTSGKMVILNVGNQFPTISSDDQKFKVYFNKESLFEKLTNRNKVILLHGK